MEDIERIGIILALLIIIDNFMSFYFINKRLDALEEMIEENFKRLKS